MTTTQPNQEQDKTLDAILDNLTFEVVRWGYGASSAETKAEQHKAKAAIQAKLAAAKDEVIGVNEPLSTSDLVADIRDNLRAEQRTRWDRVFKEWL